MPSMVDRFPKAQGFAQRARAEGYTDQEIDSYVREQFIGPAIKEGYSAEEVNEFMGIPSEKPGAVRNVLDTGAEALLGAASQVGGAPEAATMGGMTDSYEHSREELDGSLKNIFGAAGEGISHGIAMGRAVGGAAISPFIPRFIQEGMAPMLDAAGKGVEAVARFFRVPKPMAEIVGRLTPRPSCSVDHKTQLHPY